MHVRSQINRTSSCIKETSIAKINLLLGIRELQQKQIHTFTLRVLLGKNCRKHVALAIYCTVTTGREQEQESEGGKCALQRTNSIREKKYKLKLKPCRATQYTRLQFAFNFVQKYIFNQSKDKEED